MGKTKIPTVVSVAISTTITIIFWIFIALYQILTASPDPVVDSKLLKEIDPTLNTALLDSLNNKIYFEEGQSGPSLPVNLETLNQITPTEITTNELTPEEDQVPTSTEEGEFEL